MAGKREKEAQNRFERRARRYVDAAHATARRLVKRLDQPPARSIELSPREVRELYDYSESDDPASDFWALHDRILEETGDHTQAEVGALRAVYPWRADLAGVGVSELDQVVADTKKLLQIVRSAPEGEADEHPDKMGFPEPERWED